MFSENEKKALKAILNEYIIKIEKGQYSCPWTQFGECQSKSFKRNKVRLINHILSFHQCSVGFILKMTLSEIAEISVEKLIKKQLLSSNKIVKDTQSISPMYNEKQYNPLFMLRIFKLLNTTKISMNKLNSVMIEVQMMMFKNLLFKIPDRSTMEVYVDSFYQFTSVYDRIDLNNSTSTSLMIDESDKKLAIIVSYSRLLNKEDILEKKLKLESLRTRSKKPKQIIKEIEELVLKELDMNNASPAKRLRSIARVTTENWNSFSEIQTDENTQI